MSSQWRKILSPLSVLYKRITKTRNRLYDKEFLKSYEFDIPIIGVGNLQVGGTGKTPLVAYLVSLLKKEYKIAVLSRGYKRKTKGFMLANTLSTAESIGDEALQLFRQHPDIQVAVDANRVNGIETLQSLSNPPDLIILDDAFQHRKVRAGFNILLTPYNDLYTEDSHLPSGNLRECVKGAERAQLLMVTKCSEPLSEEQEFTTAVKLQPTLKQTVFFTGIAYADFIQNETEKIPVDKLFSYKIILITGIANPKPLLDFLDSKNCHYKQLSYPDHYHYKEKDIQYIENEYHRLTGKKKLILTTEKDYVRLFNKLSHLYFLSIQTKFINHQKDFDKLIKNYVEQNTRNG